MSSFWRAVEGHILALWQADLGRRGWLLALAVYILYASLPSLRVAPQWGDDFALYILQGECIAQGRPMTDTGYVFNPETPDTAPPSYPIGLPLLLAPVIALVGADTGWLTRYAILLSALLGVALFAWLRRHLSRDLPALLISLIVVANPTFVIAMRSYVESDVLFALLLVTAWALWPRGYLRSIPLWQCVAIGFFFCALISTRSVGIPLFAGYLTYEVAIQLRAWREWKGWGHLAVVLASGSALYIATQLAWPSSAVGGYQTSLNQFLSRLDLLDQVGYYSTDIIRWYARAWPHPALSVAGVFALLCVSGWLLARKQWPSPPWLVWGLLAFLSAILLWPIRQPDRLIFPLTLVLLTGLGVFFVHLWHDRPLRSVTAVLFLLMLPWGWEVGTRILYKLRVTEAAAPNTALPDRPRYSTPNQEVVRQVTDHPETPEALATWRWMRSELDSSAVVCFAKPKALALYTGLRSMNIRFDADVNVIERQLRTFHVSHLLLHEALSLSTVETYVHQQQWQPVYSNPPFAVYVVPDSLRR